MHEIQCLWSVCIVLLPCTSRRHESWSLDGLVTFILWPLITSVRASYFWNTSFIYTCTGTCVWTCTLMHTHTHTQIYTKAFGKRSFKSHVTYSFLWQEGSGLDVCDPASAYRLQHKKGTSVPDFEQEHMFLVGRSHLSFTGLIVKLNCSWTDASKAKYASQNLAKYL